MAIQSTIYNTDGTTRTFPSTKPIGTILHVGVYLKQVLDSAWVPMNVGEYTLVQNAIITDIAPDTLLYSKIEVRVADDPAEITTSPSDTAIVAGDTIAINTVASNIASVINVSNNMGAVTGVSANIASVNTVSTNIASVNTTATNITDINTTATNILDITAVADTVIPNIAEILLADDNATIATTQAGIASAQAMIATTKANEAAVSAASIDPTTIARKDITTGAVYIGSYTTANRPTLGVNDRVIGYNLTLSSYEGWSGTVWSSVGGGGATGGGSDKVFQENEMIVTTNYTITTGKSASSVGPITVNNGITVTVPNDARWVVL